MDTSFLKLYAETRGFLNGRPTKPKIAPDGKTVFFLRSGPKDAKQKLFAFDVATKETMELLSPETLLAGGGGDESPEEKARRERQRVTAGGFADYHLDPDGKRVLVSLSGKLFVFDRVAGRARELKTGGSAIDPKWSPDGKMVSYVRGYDVYVYDLATDRESAVTAGGTAVKTHGLAEFVAQEEMHRHTGYWWSPDSKFIAYEEADHTGVEVWYVADPLKPDAKPAEQYYPRPGKKNVSVRLGIIPVGGGETVWVEWTSDAPGKGYLKENWEKSGRGGYAARQDFLFTRYEYLCRVAWGQPGLVLYLQTRDQKGQAIAYIDPANGKLVSAWQTRVTDGWLNAPSELHFSKGEEYFVVDEYGANRPRLVRRTESGVAGYADAAELFGLSLRTEALVFAEKPDPTQHHVYQLTLDQPGEKPDQLTAEPGLHTAAVSELSGTLVITSTTLRALPKSTVRDSANAVVSEMPSVALEPDFKPNVTVQKAGDYWTAVVRPRSFDPKKKYPVILDVYGGPRHLRVVQAMRNWLVPQWLADQGFVVVAVDNRGTPGRGRDWERAVYQKFGTVPLDDQVKGLHALCEKFPELDRDRVGVVGWSFGGYMAANGVLRRPDVFKAAVAGAPVTDWEDYDTHYTERYLGLLPESRKAYDEASLIPLAKDFSRPLLLVHGTADDNVYFRHTLKLADALVRAGKSFEVLPLPGVTHMVTADPLVAERLWERTVRFFRQHLEEPK